MQLSKTDTARFQYQIFKQSTINLLPQEINHINCHCQLCIDNIKPIPPPQQIRETSSKEFSIPVSESLLYVLKKCANYRGIVYIPQIAFLQESTLFYTNQFGKLRMKEKVTNLEVKKFFDERRQRARYLNRLSDKTKDLYLLVYKSNTQQIMNEAHLSKILAKRKNDPFWVQAVYVYKIPETKQVQGSLKYFPYKRTKSEAERMISIMQKVTAQIDNYQQKFNKDQQLVRNNSTVSSIQQSVQRSQTIHNRNNSSSFNFNSVQMVNSLNLLQVPIASVMMRNYRTKSKGFGQEIKNIAEQLIAYIEVTTKIRILEAEFEYMEDFEGIPVIIGFRKLIVREIQAHQQCYLHDRFKSLDHIGEKELVELKKNLDKKDEEILWEVCIQILQQCLIRRKNKLKIFDYEYPSKQTLKQIFFKIFPNFSTSSIFQNINWKNQMLRFKVEIKDKINKIIQSDEGISILKRFNIYFYRIL